MSVHFFLVGNGPFTNRGCEAIVRGTMKVIEHCWGADFRVTVGTIAEPEVVAAQARRERDPRITHLPVSIYARRFSLPWWVNQGHKLSNYRGPRIPLVPHGIDAVLADADYVFSVGGDNYSLHFDKHPPYPVVDIDRYILQRTTLPIIIWGASIGPFDANPHVARALFAHLRRIHGIMARETVTYQYLLAHDVRDNVSLVADPAFMMEPEAPADWSQLEPFVTDAVGINVSPLLAAFTTGGDMAAWRDRCVAIVKAVVASTKKRVLLIPHVTVAEASDTVLMARVIEQLYREGYTENEVRLLEDSYNAAECKYIISRLAAFAGARMHATIAGLSTGVPTGSLTYSIKSIGVFRDAYGSDDYFIPATECTPEHVTALVSRLLDQAPAIREKLQTTIPALQRNALLAGELVYQRFPVTSAAPMGSRRDKESE